MKKRKSYQPRDAHSYLAARGASPLATRAGSTYAIVLMTPDIIYLRDLDLGTMSVTNDAERVVAALNATHPGKRFIYRDSNGRWDELLHDGPTFKGFFPADPPPR